MNDQPERYVYQIGGILRGRPIAGRVLLGSVLHGDLGKGWYAWTSTGTQADATFPTLAAAKAWLLFMAKYS